VSYPIIPNPTQPYPTPYGKQWPCGTATALLLATKGTGVSAAGACTPRHTHAAPCDPCDTPRRLAAQAAAPRVPRAAHCGLAVRLIRTPAAHGAGGRRPAGHVRGRAALALSCLAARLLSVLAAH